jgi:hypothetical protein
VIEAEPSETIGELKAKIQADKGWEVPQQKLIYSGEPFPVAAHERSDSLASGANIEYRQDPSGCQYHQVLQHRREGLHCLHGL